MIKAPVFAELDWLEHGFGERGSVLPKGIRTVKQIHSGIVLDAAALKQDDAGDALVSAQTGLLVGVKTADCVPILLADPGKRVVAAIHAGWRGTAENIAAAAVRELAVRWKTRPEDLRAAIGPSIGECCYEVGPEVARRFERWRPEWKEAERPTHLDLPAINEAQLRAVGVVEIWKSGECTFCVEERFFSFRREREEAGRMVSFIGKKPFTG